MLKLKYDKINLNKKKSDYFGGKSDLKECRDNEREELSRLLYWRKNFYFQSKLLNYIYVLYTNKNFGISQKKLPYVIWKF